MVANIFPAIREVIKEAKPKPEHYQRCLRCTGPRWQSRMEMIMYCIGYWLFFIAFPVFVFCKLLQAIFPYIILGYLLYYDELLNIDLFQLVMLFICIGLQFILFILGIMVCRIHWWLWHINPGHFGIYLAQQTTGEQFMASIQKWYIEINWIPIIQKYLDEIYGRDISDIIMDYYVSMDIESTITI